MAKMKNKALQTQVRISHLWNELYRENEGKGHKKAVELERTQGTLVRYLSGM